MNNFVKIVAYVRLTQIFSADRTARLTKINDAVKIVVHLRLT